MKNSMHVRQIQSKDTLIRYYAMQTVKTLPMNDIEKKLLEQQISELIQNAVVHGNKNREELIVNIRYLYKNNVFTIILQDEGNGFTEFEHWKQWNEKRSKLEQDKNAEEFSMYASYQKRGSFNPCGFGGTGLFAAFEYWDKEFSFSKEGNTLTASKIFYPTFIDEEYESD
ncbi:MAG TPA: ATP-binding protein [Treponemataceae bacterium]|nr:ATP-binding protein [Treponemataceae bacterium]